MLGTAGDEVRVPAGALARVPPLVVHGFRNAGDAELRYLNFHAPGVAFADYLRAMRDGRAFTYDQEEPPDDGGRPISEAVVGEPADARDGATVHADVEAIRITECAGDLPPSRAAGVVSLYVLGGQVVLSVSGEEHAADGGHVGADPARRRARRHAARAGARAPRADAGAMTATPGVDQAPGRPDAPVLLLTKLHAPFVPAQTIARERLFERLRGGRGLRLSLVACPAGFGKSTLLAAWREDESRRRPVAWVTLDEADDDPVVLWSHVLEALGRACPELGRAVPSDIAAAAPVIEVVLPRLVNALVEQGELVLVLDDFHRLSSPSARDGVAWLVDHLPSTVQLVLSTRTDPPLPLGALRAHGQLLELRADELQFTREEAGEFLNGRLDLELAAGDVDLLLARTEGWPAGIYLAALSLTGAEDRHALVAAFDGTSAHVVDFLAGEVLAAHGPGLQDFMLRTSVLERLCAPLCDAVLAQAGSADALDPLARSNLFLIPLDDGRRWFRFHHLFAQILRVELERREPAIVPAGRCRYHDRRPPGMDARNRWIRQCHGRGRLEIRSISVAISPRRASNSPALWLYLTSQAARSKASSVYAARITAR